MEIEYYKNSKNEFILDGKKIKVPKKISLEFYNLMTLGEYEKALELLNSRGYRKYVPYIIVGGIGSIIIIINLLVTRGIIELNIADELLWSLSFVGDTTTICSLAGVLKNVIQNNKLDNIKYKIEDTIGNTGYLNDQEKENEEIYDETYEETIDKINNNDNSFVFDSNRERNSNIVDLEEYRKKLR